jgi:hypothetical protein
MTEGTESGLKSLQSFLMSFRALRSVKGRPTADGRLVGKPAFKRPTRWSLVAGAQSDGGSPHAPNQSLRSAEG